MKEGENQRPSVTRLNDRRIERRMWERLIRHPLNHPSPARPKCCADSVPFILTLSFAPCLAPSPGRPSRFRFRVGPVDSAVYRSFPESVEEDIVFLVDPCNNSYEFSYGRWINDTVIPADKGDISLLRWPPARETGLQYIPAPSSIVLQRNGGGRLLTVAGAGKA